MKTDPVPWLLQLYKLSMQKVKKFLLVDDHDIIRGGLEASIRLIYPNCKVDQAKEGNKVLGMLKKSAYDLLILDVHLPDANVIILLGQIRKAYPALKVLIFSMTDESTYGLRLMRLGANGFVSKSAPTAQLDDAIRDILAGKKYYSPSLMERLSSEFGGVSTNPFDKLSPKEFEVCVRLLRVEAPAAISHELGLALSTIATHKARLFKKLNVTNAVQLTDLAKMYGTSW